MVSQNDAYSRGPRLSLTSVLPLRKFPPSQCYSRVGPLIIHSDRHLISPSPSASIPQSINTIKFLTFERTFPLDLAFPSSNRHQLLSVLTMHVHALYALCVWTLSLCPSLFPSSRKNNLPLLPLFPHLPVTSHFSTRHLHVCNPTSGFTK